MLGLKPRSSALPYLTSINIPFGSFVPLPVIGIPEGYTFARLRIRNDSFATVFLRRGGEFSRWQLDYNKDRTALVVTIMEACNKRTQ